MNLQKLVERGSALVSEKTDPGPSPGGSRLAPGTEGADAQGKSFRDYVQSSARSDGAQRLGDIALTESYGSALAAQILAERSQNVALARSEVDRRQSAFDRDLKQLLTENDLDSANLPKLELDAHGRILATDAKEAGKLEALLNHTPGVAEAIDRLATAKIALEQMQRQAESDANRGPRFTVSFDGPRARLSTQKKVAELGRPPELVALPSGRRGESAD